MVVSTADWLMLLGWAVWGLAWLWMGYRIIRGFLDLNNNKPMPG